MSEMMDRWQTTHTPNVLGIYLLNRALHRMKPIRNIDTETTRRARAWFAFLNTQTSWKPLIRKSSVRSKTVITLEADSAIIEKLKHSARKHGLLLGDGYGEYKQNTFRIANFPALTHQEIGRLMSFLKAF
jgi:phosphoserine aminotransferase